MSIDRNENNTMNCWTLFHRDFSIGDDVNLIDIEDKMTSGEIIGYSENGIWLKTKMNSKFYDWENIRFICQEGFPVRKIFGADGSRSIEKEDNLKLKVETALRSEFQISTIGKNKIMSSYVECRRCGILVKPEQLDKTYYRAYHKYTKERDKDYDEEGLECHLCRKENREFEIYFSDPFRIENVKVELFNIGNKWDDDNWNYYLETLTMSSLDGAKGHLTDIDTVFHYSL